VPKAVLKYMNTPTTIPGLTRANISSHLQKHRKRIAKKRELNFEFELPRPKYKKHSPASVVYSPLEFHPVEFEGI